ncbi:hypothetical protein VPDG_00097 [Vibrio phage henriette 12B8]|uniref:hypothetical protein n=1 Tax=Vibrio phage henriette 12B8 TaxID=573174 RepID=UPI0002C0B327|nr:hypothetical protein VPDG_00097 [Vibrio phage henriette 12B8]AGG58258.1 hypothetical protein VPDG_00097 [Vibrio phage henriette 12B8]
MRFQTRAHSKNSIIITKSLLGIDLSSEEKLHLAGRCYESDVDYIDQMHGCYACKGFVDQEIGYHYMEKHMRLMAEEEERERELSQGDRKWSEEEMRIQRDQLFDTDWTPVESDIVPLPKWKVDSDRIINLLGDTK